MLKHIFKKLRFELLRVIAEGGIDIVHGTEQKDADNFVKRAVVNLICEEYSEIYEFMRNFVGEAPLVADLTYTNSKGRIGLSHSIRLEAWIHRAFNKHKSKRSR